MAFASSLLLWCLPVGVFLGLRARLAIRHSGSRGQGFAVAAIAISAAGTCLFVALVGTAILGDTESDEAAAPRLAAEAVNITELRKGECFFAPQAAAPDAVPSRIVIRTSCAGFHDAEAYAVLTLPDGPFPGDAAVRDEASRGCPAALADFTPSSGAPVLAAYLRQDRPGEAAWQSGDRRVVCYVLDPGIRLNAPQ